MAIKKEDLANDLSRKEKLVEEPAQEKKLDVFERGSKAEEVKKEEMLPTCSIKEATRCTAITGLLQLYKKVNNQYKLYLQTKRELLLLNDRTKLYTVHSLSLVVYAIEAKTHFSRLSCVPRRGSRSSRPT